MCAEFLNFAEKHEQRMERAVAVAQSIKRSSEKKRRKIFESSKEAVNISSLYFLVSAVNACRLSCQS